MTLPPARYPRHDPLVCGIDPDADYLDCAACRAAADAEARALVEAEERCRHEREDQAVICQLGPPATVRRALVALLAEDITDIALAVAREVYHG